MNAPQTKEQTQALALPQELDVGPLDITSLILGPSWPRIELVGRMMSRGNVSIPKHLQGNDADCAAIVAQGLLWRINPFALAQATHLNNGKLGYEAKLIAAVLQSTGTIDGEPDYEWFGEWEKVQGKFRIEKNESDKAYAVPAYSKEDEAGLGVIVKCKLRHSGNVRALKVMLLQCFPRFSTQWATNPQKQISYRAIYDWARLYAPGAILGVSFGDADGEVTPGEKFMGSAEVVADPRGQRQGGEVAKYPQEEFDKNYAAWEGIIASGRRDAEHIIAMAEARAPLTEEQKKKLRAVQIRKPAQGSQTTGSQASPSPSPSPSPTPAPAPSQEVQDVVPKITYAQVADRMKKATTRQELDLARDAGRAIKDDQQQKELDTLYDNLKDDIPF